MKKVISILIATIVAVSPVFAQTKRDEKAAKKEAKIAAKDLKNEGYKLLELGDLQIQLESYLLKTKSGQKQIIGTGYSLKSRNLAIQDAKNNALNDYASLSGGMVKGRITSNASRIADQEIDDIIAAYERLVLKELKGEVQFDITLIRENKGRIDVRVYGLLDYDSAHAARMKAMRLALEELELTQQYGSQVSDWIDEGLNR